MAYIVGEGRNQLRIITTSLDDFIDKDNPVHVIDAYVESLDLKQLGFIEYSGSNKGQASYKRSGLLKLHIYGYLNNIKSSSALELETKRNLELMWFINSITPDHGTIDCWFRSEKRSSTIIFPLPDYFGTFTPF